MELGKVSVYDDEGFLWSHRLVSVPLDDPISIGLDCVFGNNRQ